eukprot:7774903-Pyramimonas_sp.AAC.1
MLGMMCRFIWRSLIQGCPRVARQMLRDLRDCATSSSVLQRGSFYDGRRQHRRITSQRSRASTGSPTAPRRRSNSPAAPAGPRAPRGPRVRVPGPRA